MASVALITSAGVSSSAMPFKARSVDLVTSAGVAASTRQVDWAGSASPLSRVPWLPKAGTPLLLPGSNQLSPAWDRALRWLFDEYIGGLNAPTIPQVTQSVAATQAQVVTNTTYTQQAVAYASGVAATADATRETAIAAGLPGSGSIPSTPQPPTQPPTQVEL
jgi:hypothetical protein